MLYHGPAARDLRGGVAMTGTAYTAPPRVLGLVADDLTGAADSAVGFAEHCWWSNWPFDRLLPVCSSRRLPLC